MPAVVTHVSVLPDLISPRRQESVSENLLYCLLLLYRCFKTQTRPPPNYAPACVKRSLVPLAHAPVPPHEVPWCQGIQSHPQYPPRSKRALLNRTRSPPTRPPTHPPNLSWSPDHDGYNCRGAVRSPRLSPVPRVRGTTSACGASCPARPSSPHSSPPSSQRRGVHSRASPTAAWAAWACHPFYPPLSTASPRQRAATARVKGGMRMGRCRGGRVQRGGGVGSVRLRGARRVGAWSREEPGGEACRVQRAQSGTSTRHGCLVQSSDVGQE